MAEIESDKEVEIRRAEGGNRKAKKGAKGKGRKWVKGAKIGRGISGATISDSNIRAVNRLLRRSPEEIANVMWNMGKEMGLSNEAVKEKVLENFANWESRDGGNKVGVQIIVSKEMSNGFNADC